MKDLDANIRWWIFLHCGCGVLQFVVWLFAGDDVVYYGGSGGFLGITPLAGFVTDDSVGFHVADPLDFGGVFSFLTDLGNLVVGLAAYDYSVITRIQSDAGFVFWGVIVFRLVTGYLSIRSGLAIAQVLFQSNILGSNWGLAMIVGGVGLTSLVGLLGLGIAF